jgi:hypothetical protein
MNTTTRASQIQRALTRIIAMARQAEHDMQPCGVKAPNERAARQRLMQINSEIEGVLG